MSEKENETMLSPITDKEICKCIARVKRDSAPGVDGITRQAILVHLKEKPGELRSMQVSNFVPSCLTPNRSILLPKSGDPTIVNNWRPLTIGTLVLRLYTAMLARRISNAVKLNPRQRGFIPAQSCFENLYLLQGIMRDAKASGRYLAVTFIDLAKAFDTISHDHVVKGLERFGVDCQMIGMVKALYTGVSKTFAVGDGHTGPFPILQGVKQDDPMSPILFNMCIDPLLSKLDELKAGYKIDDER